MSSLADRLPPQDLEAEQATLGAMMIEAGALTRALNIVAESDFYREAHRCIFAAMKVLHEAGQPVDCITVGSELRKREQLAQVGGGEYLTRLIEKVPTTAHVIRYANTVHDLARMRAVILEAGAIREAAYSWTGTPRDFLAQHLTGIQDIAANCSADRTARHTSTTLPELAERIERQRDSQGGLWGARTGIISVDAPMGGLQEWGMIVVRADTKVGKSLFAGQPALATARALRDEDSERVVLAYILEAREEWEERALAWLGGFDKRLLERRGMPMTDEEHGRYEAALTEYAGLPLYLTDELTQVGDILLDIEQHTVSGRRPALVVVDHFQRVLGDGESGTLRYDDAARRLASIPRTYRCPVMVPSQVTSDNGVRHSMWARALDQEATIVFDLLGERDQPERELRAALPRKYIPFHSLRYFISDGGDARLFDEQSWLSRQAARRDRAGYQ